MSTGLVGVSSAKKCRQGGSHSGRREEGGKKRKIVGEDSRYVYKHPSTFGFAALCLSQIFFWPVSKVGKEEQTLAGEGGMQCCSSVLDKGKGVGVDLDDYGHYVFIPSAVHHLPLLQQVP